MWRLWNLLLFNVILKLNNLNLSLFKCKSFKFTCDDIEIYNFQLVIIKLYNLNLQLFNVKVLNLHVTTLKFTTFNICNFKTLQMKFTTFYSKKQKVNILQTPKVKKIKKNKEK
jgi:hypothetical protein